MEQERDVGTASPEADLEKRNRRSDRETRRLGLEWVYLRATIEAMRGLANASAEAFRVLNDELQTTDRVVERGSGTLFESVLKGNLEFVAQLAQTSEKVLEELRTARRAIEPTAFDYERLARMVAAEIMKNNPTAKDPIGDLRTQ